MESKTIGIIVTGIVLLAIILAFIFNGRFRKDVIASEGEAAVLGMINVKGVIIVLLTAIFGGLLAFMVQLDTQVDTAELTDALAIEHLSKSSEDMYSLHNQGDNLVIRSNGVEIGVVGLDTNSKLAASKSPSDSKNWFINKGNSRLGYVSSRMDQEQITYDDRNRSFFYPKKMYPIGNLDLVFMIDSIYKSHPSNKNTIYHFVMRYGEKRGDDKVHWGSPMEHLKTKDGRLTMSNGLKRIHDPDWVNNYYIGLGLGQPSHDSVTNSFTGVEKLNLLAIESKLE